MPTKPPYDPDLHLSEAKKKEIEDEALARRLHEEMLAEEAERDRMRRMQDEANQRDMELARRLQFEDDMSDDAIRRHLEERQRETGISDQLEYARRLQQQALRDVSDGRTTRDAPSRSSSNEDEELARRMHDLYEMGMDSCTDFERFEELRNSSGHSSTDSGIRSDPNHGGHQKWRSQEEEDAAIARMMAESGESLRFLDLDNLPPPGSDDRSRTTPGAHHVPIPAGYSETLMQAAMNSNHRALGLQEDEPDHPQQTPFETRSARRDDESRSQPIASMNRRPLTRQQNRLQTFPEQEMDPPGVPLPPNMMDSDNFGNEVSNSRSKPKAPRGGRFGLGMLPKSLNLEAEKVQASPQSSKPRIKVTARPPPSRKPGPVPYSFTASRLVSVPIAETFVPKKKSASRSSRQSSQNLCDACKQPASHYLSALDKKYHHDCFRCTGCHNLIDAAGPFAYMEDEAGEKHPLHKECFSELYGVKCAVCRKTIPAGPDGKVSFVKHPFFDTEQMCPSHAATPGRRCTGCHRFEPVDEPFADLDDAGRVVCYSCCRTAVVDSSDAEPLWQLVIDFFEKKLNLPIWADMRKVPVLIVGYKSLNEQMKQTGGVHGGSAQIMTRGVCLTEHQTSGRKLKTTTLKFNERKQSFEKCDVHQRGFTFLQVPDANKVNPDSSVTCILCLSGLPKDLTASVLAHEATHAWIKLHPRYDVLDPLDPQVEEGCAQLIAMLFLNEGLPPASNETDRDGGPSEEKLRQYFKFSIESDNHEIYGEGYRKAAAAYSAIGIEALMGHVVLYKKFPKV